MIKITSNLGNVLGKLTAKLKAVADPNGVLRDKLLRTLATTAGAEMKFRIHIEGLKSDGTQIGTYSNSYLKIRQSRNNRTSDPKVILSATRQMENDFFIKGQEPIKTSNGYGLGFKNNAVYNSKGKKATTKQVANRLKNGGVRTVSNEDKAKWLQEKYGTLYAPTDSEKDLLRRTTEQFIKDLADHA